jgi:hypothetical protein
LFAPALTLEQNGEVQEATTGQLLSEQYPTSRWQAGELVRERRMLQIPLSAAPGSAMLSLCWGERCERLGELEITGAEQLAALPAEAQSVDVTFGEFVRLVGYSLPQTTVNAGEEVVLTLYWQAITSVAGDYTVFTHILDADGRLIGQHDGPPADGRRPVSSWLPGELIADTHAMAFRDRAYTGPATVEVGLYDPQTGQRLLMPNGDDAFKLPLTLSIKGSNG